MDLYTEKIENSDSLNKITVRFQSHRDYLYSGWEINQISNTLNNVYYKNELINTLKSLLLNGTDPKDIYILNSSVKVGYKYSLIKDGNMNLKKSRDIINLYYMGSPIPLFPSEDTLKIYYIFEIFRLLYKKCKSLGLTPPNRRNTIHNLVENRTDIINANLLKEYLNAKIYENNSLLETKELDEKVKRVFNTLDNSLKHFDNLFSDLELLDEFSKQYSENIEDGLKLEEYNVLNKYFNSFKKNFNKLDRPFICVHKKEEQQLFILCTDLISVENFTEDNYRFYETKNISQNSPLTIAICIGIGFAPSLLKIGEALLSARKTVVKAKEEDLKLKEEKGVIDLKIVEQETELDILKREINELNSEIEEIKKNTTKNRAVNEANKIISDYTSSNGAVDSFIGDIVNSLEEKNNENLVETLEDKELNIDNVATKEIEAS